MDNYEYGIEKPLIGLKHSLKCPMCRRTVLLLEYMHGEEESEVEDEEDEEGEVATVSVAEEANKPKIKV
jgi:hypothetical protein